MDMFSPHKIWIRLVIVVYVLVATLYAIYTPLWQVPDEPAHYNYVRALAEEGRFPIIEPGDYDQAYLTRLTTEKFPPGLSIRPLEYEDHQPPLYYLLATPAYRLFAGRVLPIRMLSVLFGIGLLIAAFQTVRTLFPQQPGLAVLTASFIAFIPQHVAMSAGINNDLLAECIVASTLWALVRYVQRKDDPRPPWTVGLLVAIALLTKTTAYVVVVVAALAVVLRGWQEQPDGRWWRRHILAILVPPVLIAAPWFIRNGCVYGWNDPLGLARHNAIVENQPLSSEWLARYGWAGLLGRAIQTTFQSFWGQFGWMAIVLPRPLYGLLLGFSALAGGGFLGWAGDRRRPRLDWPTCAGLMLLATSATLTFLSFVWYNLTFVQHQGRYLFPALVPIGLAVALGLVWLSQWVPGRWRRWVLAGLPVGMVSLDIYCLFRFILPYLTR